MARKKKHRETAMHTKESAKITVEPLDYEKLAQCIAKAIAGENDKRTNAYSVTREWMKFIICPIFWLITMLSGIFAVGFFIYTCMMICTATSDITNIVKGLVSFMLSLICISLAVPAFFVSKEFDKEKDRQFVVSVFSGMVSLIALIVALVALVMGVK